MIGYM